MSLNRWDPFRDLLNFQERVHRLVHPGTREWEATERRRWHPAVDVLETPEAYIIRADLPGVGSDNISIEVRGSVLMLSGERSLELEPEIAAYHSIEKLHGFFEWHFNLPGHVDVENAKARYVDGVLEIFLPKCEEEKPERAITVVCL
jgi:HSP20 family protein